MEHGPDPETSSAEERRHPYGEWQAVVPENRHNWGRGRTLEGPDPVGDGDDGIIDLTFLRRNEHAAKFEVIQLPSF